LNPKERILESIFRIGARSRKNVLRSTAQNRFATQSDPKQTRDAAKLLKQMFALGISRYHPDPLAAIQKGPPAVLSPLLRHALGRRVGRQGDPGVA
jgi:hypothetical protein